MRIPTEYEQYLLKLRISYWKKNQEPPAWIDEAIKYHNMLLLTCRELHKSCSNSSISRKTMSWLSTLEQENPSEEIPKNLYERAIEGVRILSEMYRVLIDNQEEFFINEWTLTKAGRKKMREYLDKMPSVRGLNPPENGDL